MSNRWRPEAKLAERTYKLARPYLESLPSRSMFHSPDASIRDTLCAGHWSDAVAHMLYLGWQPDPTTREAIWRMWIIHNYDAEIEAALKFESWTKRRTMPR
jgi:hypothetical protein